MVHEYDVKSPTIFVCAQAGCGSCLERLLVGHEGLVRAVIRRSYVGCAEYADLLQEGRVGLWRAICGFDPERGVAFSSYAWPAIERAVWREVTVAERQAGAPKLPCPTMVDPEAAALVAWQRAAVRTYVGQALSHLSQRARHVITAAYGLDGQPVRSLAAIGRAYGVSREAVRVWRNDALVLLRLPAVSPGLSRLCDQNGRPAYRRRQRLSQTWQRRRRRRRP
jgi:RNA polymerase sigma factor (sigma-70 family)